MVKKCFFSISNWKVTIVMKLLKGNLLSKGRQIFEGFEPSKGLLQH